MSDLPLSKTPQYQRFEEHTRTIFGQRASKTVIDMCAAMMEAEWDEYLTDTITSQTQRTERLEALIGAWCNYVSALPGVLQMFANDGAKNARNWAKTRDDAEDILQSVLLAWLRHPEYWILAPDARLRLLRQSIRNRASDLYSGKTPPVSLDQPLDASVLEGAALRDLLPDEATSKMDQHVADVETAERIRQLLYRIHPNLPEAFHLEDVEGESRKDVADRLGWNFNTLTAARNRARVKVSRILAVSQNDPQRRLRRLLEAMQEPRRNDDPAFLTYMRALVNDLKVGDLPPIGETCPVPEPYDRVTFVVDLLLLKANEWCGRYADQAFSQARNAAGRDRDDLTPAFELILRLIAKF